MSKHLKITSVTFVMSVLLMTSCGISNNKIRYGSKKDQLTQTTKADNHLNELADKDLLSEFEKDTATEATELKPRSAQRIKSDEILVSPVIYKSLSENRAHKMIPAMDEATTQDAHLNSDEEVTLEAQVVEKEAKDPSPDRTKRNGKRSLIISLGTLVLTFVILILGVAGAITSSALSVLLVLFGLMTLVFLILGLTLLIIAGNRRRKENKVN